VVLSKSREVVGLGYLRLIGGATKVIDRGRIQVTPAGLPGLARRSNTARVGLAGFAKIATWIDKQIGIAGLAKIATQISKQIGLAKTAARIDGQIRLGGLTGLATRSRKWEVPVRLLKWKAELRKIRLTKKAGLWKIQLTRKAGLRKIWLTRKAGLQRIRLIRKAGLRKIWLAWKTGLCKTRGAGNRKKKKVLLQTKGQLHGGAQGELPRHKNAD
jgi:hypothetical protein